MHLNLPILDQLSSCRSLLIAGMGGGFDVFCGLPVCLELQRRGQTVHLGSLSFSPHVRRIREGVRLTETLVGVTADYPGITIYFPELYLARWFRERRGEERTIWCFQASGGQPMLAAYRALVEHLALDGILLIDGGVDSLVRGDEAQLGTAIEDSLTLAAVSELEEVPVRLLGCLGFGAEQDISHTHVLENVAALTAAGAFLGSCSLVRRMEVYQAYEDAVTYAHQQPYQDPSVINASVISAARGHYGNYHLTEKTRGHSLWISPLMPLYWFFDLPAVAERNLLLSQLRWSETVPEAMQLVFMIRRNLRLRTPARIPLS